MKRNRIQNKKQVKGKRKKKNSTFDKWEKVLNQYKTFKNMLTGSQMVSDFTSTKTSLMNVYKYSFIFSWPYQ